MAEQIITKLCRTCKEIKLLTEFYKHQGCKDGHLNVCKICTFIRDKKYRQTEQGKATQNRYHQSEKGKATKRRYRQTEHGKAVQDASVKRCSQSEKRKAAKKQYQQSKIGKAVHKKALLRHKKRNPKKHAAKNAVNNAVRDGKLPRPDSLFCKYCYEKAEHYHHPSYAKEHRLDVLPVCSKCHSKLHLSIHTGDL